MKISNGEIDVFLSLEKASKYIKIYFAVENGNKDDFFNFKKIMRKFHLQQK